MTPRASGTLPVPELEARATLETDLSMWAVVFAGGIGSRFWPLSTPARPKPLLALVTGRSLLEDTVGRLQPLIPPERVLIVTSHDIAPAIRAAVSGVPPENILVEPRPLGTAAAFAWGAREVSRRAGPDTVFCAMHADLAIGFPDVFRHTLQRAGALSQRERALVSLGVRPSRPEPHFGYLHPGDPLDAAETLSHGGACEVREFVEKPTAEEAAALISAGGLWHSGVLAVSARTALDSLRDFTPEIAAGLDVLDAGDLDQFVERIASASIERGLLERTERLLVLLSEFGWDDVGTWASLRRARDLDDDGNGALGAAEFVDAESNVVHCEAGSVVLFGVERLLVVSLDGLTFVTTLDRANDLKPLLDSLPGSMRIHPTGGESGGGK